MIYKFNIPKTVPVILQWMFKIWLIYFIIFTSFRIVTFILLGPIDIHFISLLPSFLLGFQYDVKWIAFILLPIGVLSVYHKLSPFYSRITKNLWAYYLGISTFIVLLFFGADFATFSYNHTRINASVLNFSEDFKISYKMIWQTYPIVWIFLGLMLSAGLLVKLFKKIHSTTLKKNRHQKNTIYYRRWHACTIIFLAWSVYGIFSITPLKWGQAFKFNDNFKSYLALNPLQNFFSTLSLRTPLSKGKMPEKDFPLMAGFLGLDSTNRISAKYERIIAPDTNSIKTRPNVVLVVGESFSMYKSSMSGNPLNSTPYFNKLTSEGIFFERCFSATFGTARGIFALITGIPDVELSKFATRNPQAINQHTIINSFKDYSKLYFLGGSSSFNNFTGLIKNIDGVKIFQEGSYKSPQLNVWGISDKNLFLEANDELKKQSTPFFAIIQTSDNHRPFTIPEEDKDFEKRVFPSDTIKKYGFESLAEFQSFCYTDYCFKKFIEASRQQSYFNNTIFVFIGDHGLEGNATEMYPLVWTSARLSAEHVPLLFYAPGLLKPQLRKEVVSQIDVLPTIGGIIHQPYVNTTLGRDILHTKNKFNAAFIIHHDEGNIGVVTDKYYYSKNILSDVEDLAPVTADTFNLSAVQKDSVKRSLFALTSAIYETSKWMMLNNKKHGKGE
ncbi:MAG: sulfatase-like hydrolase/transferase [Ginsengibacter sp.]